MSTVIQRAMAPIDPVLGACMGPPPLISGENPDEYNHLWESLRQGVRPANAVEELDVRKVVDYYWDLRRYRQTKVRLLESSRANGLWRILQNLVSGTSERTELMMAWAGGDAAARERADQLLRDAGMGQEHLEAQALIAELRHVLEIDRLIVQGERRIEAVFREVDRRRDSLSRRLREGLSRVEEADVIGETGPVGPVDF